MSRTPICSLDGLTPDVVVVGAGVNGASGAHHLAAEGYSVLLVDKRDFGSGSSSRSSRLLHCGLRFIEPGEGLGYRNPSMWEPLLKPKQFLKNLTRVRDAMSARHQIASTMPERVRRFRFHFPVWRGDLYQPWQVAAGMRLVASLGPRDGPPMDIQRLSRADALQSPLLEWLRRPQDLLSVHSWSEFRYEWPERIVMDTVLDAERMGAVVRNYTAVTKMERRGERWLLELTDSHDGATACVEAECVLNTTGIWTDRVNALAPVSVGRRIMGTKGAHIMFRLPPACESTGICTHTTKREPFYIVPWRGMHYAGPTDTPFDGDIDDIHATEDEIDHLVNEVNSLVPGAALQRGNVLFSWAGVRPLTFSPDEPMGLRGHRLHDLTCEGMENVFNMTSSPIQSHRLAGRQLSNAVKAKIRPSGAPQAISYSAVEKPESADSPALLNHWPDARIGDLRHAAEHEHPVTLDDLLFRRIGAGWTETMGREGARVAAEAVADILHWDAQRVDREVEEYLQILENRHGVRT